MHLQGKWHRRFTAWNWQEISKCRRQLRSIRASSSGPSTLVICTNQLIYWHCFWLLILVVFLQFFNVICRNTESIIHLLKCSLGTGILAMPQAIYHAGYVLGAIGTAAIGILCLYCIQLLLESHYELCKRKKVSKLIRSYKTAKANRNSRMERKLNCCAYRLWVINYILEILIQTSNVNGILCIYRFHPWNIQP